MFLTTSSRSQRVRAGGPLIFALFVLFLVGSLLGAGGCQNTGSLYSDGPPIETTKQAILIADAEIRGQVLLVTDLLRRNVITAQQASTAHRHLQEAKNATQSGLNAINVAGDPLVAQSELERADAALTLALQIVAPYVTPQPQ